MSILPMKYPGLPVGATSRLLTTWKPALDKTKNDVILGKQNVRFVNIYSDYAR